MAKNQHKPAAPATDPSLVPTGAENPGAAPAIPTPAETQAENPGSVGDIEVEVTDDEILAGLGESDLERMRKILSLAEQRKRAGVVAPEDAELVRVYNRGRRRFDHAPYQSHPAAFATVPRWLAKKWLADWPADFVAGDDAVKSIDATQGALNEAKAKIQELENQLKAAKAQK